MTFSFFEALSQVCPVGPRHAFVQRLRPRIGAGRSMLCNITRSYLKSAGCRSAIKSPCSSVQLGNLYIAILGKAECPCCRPSTSGGYRKKLHRTINRTAPAESKTTPSHRWPFAILVRYMPLMRRTPPWRIRLKARVDLSDQTAEFMPFEAIRTAIPTYFYLFLGINYAF